MTGPRARPYANIENSYLLQWMEAYDRIVVLATILREDMDDAFTRWIRFVSISLVDMRYVSHTVRREFEKMGKRWGGL